jgi:hypothetical protein
MLEALESQIAGRRASVALLHQQGDAAAEKLAYLLNLPPGSTVVPQDATLEPMELVDVSVPADVLVTQAISDGPGIRELEGLSATIEEAIGRVGPCLAHLPKIARELEKARYKLDETRLALEDARGKLAAGVREAREAILSGRQQIRERAVQVGHSAEAYRLNDLRLRENPRPGRSALPAPAGCQRIQQGRDSPPDLARPLRARRALPASVTSSGQ